MYLKRSQVIKIRESAEEIVRLATLETCALPSEIKEGMRDWVQWFSSYGITILNTLDEGMMN